MKYLIFTLAPGQDDVPVPYRAAAVFFYNDWKRAMVTPILASSPEIAEKAAETWIEEELNRVAAKGEAMTVRKPRKRREEAQAISKTVGDVLEEMVDEIAASHADQPETDECEEAL